MLYRVMMRLLSISGREIIQITLYMGPPNIISVLVESLLFRADWFCAIATLPSLAVPRNDIPPHKEIGLHKTY